MDLRPQYTVTPAFILVPMIKLFLTLFCFALIAAAMLQLREQKRELGYEINQLHTQIESRQSKLWNQQLQIAAATAPRVLKQTIAQHHLPLATDPRIPSPAGNWTNSPTDAVME